MFNLHSLFYRSFCNLFFIILQSIKRLSIVNLQHFSYKAKASLLLLLVSLTNPVISQRVLSLDECRQMALMQNKKLLQSKLSKELAQINSRVAQTNYLPKISGIAGFAHVGQPIQLFSDENAASLQTMGSRLAQRIQTTLQTPQAQGVLMQNPDLLPLIQLVQGALPGVATDLNSIGKDLSNFLNPNVHNMSFGAILLTQPLYMGGKIRAYHRITEMAELMAEEQSRNDNENVLLEVDRAYWQTVSLAHKCGLANSFKHTLLQLDSNVIKMINEGVATRADELKVSVKLNEADMMLTKAENGLVLSRMLLATLCGLLPDEELRCADEQREELAIQPIETHDVSEALINRPELKQLALAEQMQLEKAKITRSDFLPQLAFTAGFIVTNPGFSDGLRKRFEPNWNLGFTLKVPIWNWKESVYKVRAAQTEAKMIALRAADVREKISLQMAQENFRVNEAIKRIHLAHRNLDNANENLRMANLGYKEGVVVLSDVLSAQTMWLQAKSEIIDAQIEAQLAYSQLLKAAGKLSK